MTHPQFISPFGMQRAARDRALLGAQLGAVAAPRAREPGFEAAVIAVSVVGSLTSLVLYANGHTKLAASVGATGILIGGVVAIAQVLSGDEDVVVEP